MHNKSQFLVFIILSCQAVFRIECMSVAKPSPNDDSESDIDTILELLSALNTTKEQSSLDIPVVPSPTPAQKPTPFRAKEINPLSPFQDLPKAPIGVPKSIPIRHQSKGLDFYYPEGTANLRSHAKNPRRGFGLMDIFGNGQSSGHSHSAGRLSFMHSVTEHMLCSPVVVP
jgi:hypothetical protein